MKKRVVKLDQKALRGLIREAIQGRQPGSPLFTPPPEKRTIRESNSEGYDMVMDLVTKVTSGWQYDPNDPSMAATGEEAWEGQVSQAEDELLNRIAEVIEDVQTKLINGEYYSG